MWPILSGPSPEKNLIDPFLRHSHAPSAQKASAGWYGDAGRLDLLLSDACKELRFSAQELLRSAVKNVELNQKEEFDRLGIRYLSVYLGPGHGGRAPPRPRAAGLPGLREQLLATVAKLEDEPKLRRYGPRRNGFCGRFFAHQNPSVNFQRARAEARPA